MESVLPADLVSALDRAAGGAAFRGRRLVALSGERRYGVRELTETAMVVETEGRPPMRGDVELVSGGERIARLLVTLDWVRDGLARYEFKRTALFPPVRRAGEDPGAIILPGPVRDA